MEARLSGSDVSFDPYEDDNAPSMYLSDPLDPMLKLSTIMILIKKLVN
ncbi:MAG: hypothetical protein Ct9H90mP18_06980 [Gammaproteobacteria bacterium]|nr:MAG: hypothetical protein Ct9H90mP18_06980 [Gammaproteobacteria bacterium]